MPDRCQPCQLPRCCSFHHSGCTCSYIYSSTCPCTVSLGDCTVDGIGTASDGAPARLTGQGLTFPYRCQSRLAMRCEGITRNPGHFFRACQKQVHPKKYANILARYRRINALQLGTSAGGRPVKQDASRVLANLKKPKDSFADFVTADSHAASAPPRSIVSKPELRQHGVSLSAPAWHWRFQWGRCPSRCMVRLCCNVRRTPC